MGLTKDFLRYIPNGVCNIVGSANGAIQCVDNVSCAVAACENVNFYNMRTLEKTYQISAPNKTVTTFVGNRDKSVFAIGYSDGEVHLYRRSTEKDVVIFNGHKTGVNCLAFSEDGLTLASGGKDSVIILWDIVGECGRFRLTGHKGSITQLKFTENSKYLISSSKDFQLKFWNMNSQTCFYTIADNVTEVYTFALLKSDRLLVIGSGEIELLVFELKWLDSLEDEDENTQNGLFSSEFAPNEKSTNSDNQQNPKKVKLNEENGLIGADFIEEENAQANKILRCKKRGTLIRQAKGKALQMAISSDKTILTCLGSDSLMDVYRIFTKEESEKRFSRKLRKEKRKVDEINDEDPLLEKNIAKDVTLLITRIGEFRADSKIKWVDFVDAISQHENIRTFRLYCLLNHNNVLGVQMKIDLKSNEVICAALTSLERRGHRTDILSLSIASNGKQFLSGATESAILWDFDTLLPKNCFKDDKIKQVIASIFTPGDKEIVLCTKDGCIFLYNLAECELIEEHIKIHEGPIWGCVLLPNKKGFITCGKDKKARFWNFEFVNEFGHKRISLKLSRVLELPDEILCVAVSSNEKFVAFGLLDNTARIYFMDSLKFFVSLYGHSLPIFCMDISPDSKIIITGSGDKTVRIWGLDFGDCHKSLFAHDDVVTCVKFGADLDEKLFWSAGKDGKIKQWDAIKFHKIQTLSGHNSEINALASNPDGTTLISASKDRSIRLWELSDEIINLQEEEENAREKEYDEKLLDMEDIIPGEALEREADLAPIKSIESIKSTEKIMECIELLRNERSKKEYEAEMYKADMRLNFYAEENFDFYVLDILKSIRSSNLEKSLLPVPLNYVPDILKSLCFCVKKHYKLELACRVVMFLLRIHHNQIINSMELLPVINDLRKILPSEIDKILEEVGFNLAALRFFQMHLEERDEVQLFRDVSQIDKEKKSKKRKSKKIKQVALLKTLL